MIARFLADVQVTGSTADDFVYALGLAGGALVFVIVRTSPRRRSGRPLSSFELRIQQWLWRRHRTREGAILGVTTALGGLGCIVAFFLPVATYTSYAMYPGDPLAGVQEIEPTVKGLAMVLGLVIALLSLRRAFGGESVTTPICLLVATLIVYFIGLAIGDIATNAATGASQYMSAVVVGPGLLVLAVAAIVAWTACAADLAFGLRSALHVVPSTSPPPQPEPLPPPLLPRS